MRVFVMGAAGAIGRSLVPMLVHAGHEVTGTTRKPERAEWLRGQGATAVTVDAFDAGGVHAAVADAEPEVVIHQLTDIPADLDPRRYEEQMAGNDRIRREATPILVDAARNTGARRLIAQSIAFAYDPSGEGLKAEDDPLFADPPGAFRRTVQALRTMEEAVLGADSLEGVVLRYGYFYGPGTSYASDGGIAARVRKRGYPILGDGGGVSSFIHVDDAAAATVAALDHGGPGIYNVVDDDPAPVREWLPAYAAALGAKKPMRVPAFVGKIAAGDFVTMLALKGRGASNAKAKRELGWTPRLASWRDGFREALG
jgi:nucleoside-diphosphate-sugar epimerase